MVPWLINMGNYMKFCALSSTWYLKHLVWFWGQFIWVIIWNTAHIIFYKTPCTERQKAGWPWLLIWPPVSVVYCDRAQSLVDSNPVKYVGRLKYIVKKQNVGIWGIKKQNVGVLDPCVTPPVWNGLLSIGFNISWGSSAGFELTSRCVKIGPGNVTVLTCLHALVF